MSKVGNLTIWINPFRKSRGDKTPPDFKGKCDIGGRVYELSLWVNETVGDYPIHLSGQISTEHKGGSPRTIEAPDDDEGDEIPF